MNYDAAYFARLLVAVSKRQTSRRSYKYGISRGTGHIPYDTGATQNSIYLARITPNSATVKFESGVTPYAVDLQYSENIAGTLKPNLHKGFLQRFAKNEFVTELRRQFGKVEIK